MMSYPAITSMTIQGLLDFSRQISRLRSDDVNEVRNLNNRLVQGRLRTDRSTPSSHTDVNDGIDKLGDIVRTAAYEYVVVNDSGTLKWSRSAVDVTW